KEAVCATVSSESSTENPEAIKEECKKNEEENASDTESVSTIPGTPSAETAELPPGDEKTISFLTRDEEESEASQSHKRSSVRVSTDLRKYKRNVDFPVGTLSEPA